jgi:hypothetical protein
MWWARLLNTITGLLGGAGAPVVGDYESIATTVVGSGGSSSITFSSIPSIYKHLQIRLAATTTASGGSISFRFNSDSGANYTFHRVIGNGSSASAAGASTSGRTLATIIGANTTQPSPAVVDILDYANNNKYKTVRALCGYDYNGSGEVALYSNLWVNTAAITSINVILEGGLTYAQHSHFALYGIKG